MQMSPAKKAALTRKRRMAARKAVRTKCMRDLLYARYGHETFDVLTAFANGMNNNETSYITGVPFNSVLAYKANLTRGCYGDISFLRTRR